MTPMAAQSRGTNTYRYNFYVEERRVGYAHAQLHKMPKRDEHVT